MYLWCTVRLPRQHEFRLPSASDIGLKLLLLPGGVNPNHLVLAERHRGAAGDLRVPGLVRGVVGHPTAPKQTRESARRYSVSRRHSVVQRRLGCAEPFRRKPGLQACSLCSTSAEMSHGRTPSSNHGVSSLAERPHSAELHRCFRTTRAGWSYGIVTSPGFVHTS